MRRALPREWYTGDALDVAPRLLNKVLAVYGAAGEVEAAGRIVEVEAYMGADDPGSHAFRGRTVRNATMFGPAGHLYVYFTYGMHWCANVVCGEEGVASAVLLRALAPVEGLDLMRSRRPAARRDHDLCSGPAKLCQALAIDRSFDGADLVASTDGVAVLDDGTPLPRRPGRSTRIGLTAGAEHAWRWYVEGDPNVSRHRTGSGRRRRGRHDGCP